MSRNGVIHYNTGQINASIKIKNKNSIIDLAIKKAIYSKNTLLKFFEGKQYLINIIYN